MAGQWEKEQHLDDLIERKRRNGERHETKEESVRMDH